MSGIFRRVIKTVDSHTEGAATRVITGGYRIPPGRTLLEKQDWLRRNDDGLRRLLNFEPRGHDMMCSVLLMPACVEGADFSVIIMEQDEYVPMSGHCVIGTAATVIATGMVEAREPFTMLHIETPAGVVTCAVEVRNARVGRVSIKNVDAFLLHRAARVEAPGLGALSVDVAYGGDFYAIVDAAALGLRLAPEGDAALIAAAQKIIPAVNEQLAIRHPEHPEIDRCYQTLFASANATRGEVSQVVVCPPGALDRSPCGTGSCARLAAMLAKGEIALDQEVRFTGPLGTSFIGAALASEERGGITYVRPELTGRAFITGFHQFVLDPEDPLPDGFRIGPQPRPAPEPQA